MEGFFQYSSGLFSAPEIAAEIYVEGNECALLLEALHHFYSSFSRLRAQSQVIPLVWKQRAESNRRLSNSEQSILLTEVYIRSYTMRGFLG